MDWGRTVGMWSWYSDLKLIGDEWIDRISTEGKGDSFSSGCVLSKKKESGIDPSACVSWGFL